MEARTIAISAVVGVAALAATGTYMLKESPSIDLEDLVPVNASPCDAYLTRPTGPDETTLAKMADLAREDATRMNCDALLKGSAECLKQQKAFYDRADGYDQQRQKYLAEFASQQAAYNACVAERQRLLAPPKNAGTEPNPPKPAEVTDAPPAAPPVAVGPPSPPPDAPRPPVVVAPPVSVPPVALGPPIGAPPPYVPPAVTPPVPSDTLTCYYTDAQGQQRTSFTTKDAEIIKQGCPPYIFPGLVLVSPAAPGGGVSGPLTPLTPLPPIPVGPVAIGPPPASATSDNCDVWRQRLVWLKAETSRPELQTDAFQAYKAYLGAQLVEAQGAVLKCDDQKSAAPGSSGGSSGPVGPVAVGPPPILVGPPGGPPPYVPPLIDIITVAPPGGGNQPPPTNPPTNTPPATTQPTTPASTPGSSGGCQPGSQKYQCVYGGVAAVPQAGGGSATGYANYVMSVCVPQQGFSGSTCTVDTVFGATPGPHTSCDPPKDQSALTQQCKDLNGRLMTPKDFADVYPAAQPVQPHINILPVAPLPPVAVAPMPKHNPVTPLPPVALAPPVEIAPPQKASQPSVPAAKHLAPKPRVSRPHEPSSEPPGLDPATASALLGLGLQILQATNRRGGGPGPAPQRHPAPATRQHAPPPMQHHQ